MTGPDGEVDLDDRDPEGPPSTLVGEGSHQTARTKLSFRERAEAAAAVEAIFRGDGPPDFDDISGPLHWPKVPAADAVEAWEELRRWVEHLLERFSHLDHHAIPLCWWRHNGHVEALAALRDHERMCYSDSSPPTAAVEWHRAFRDIESRLREWTSTLSCGAAHDPRARPARGTDGQEWQAFLSADTERRAQPQPQTGDNRGTPAAPPDSRVGNKECTG
jgi:hypothetical protein